MNTFEGQVSGFQQRWELDAGQNVLVWDFRLERNDPGGTALPRVPVSLRGKRFDGAINDGDWVSVSGDWKEGETLGVDEVKNLTTGAEVKGQSGRTAAGNVGRVFGYLLFIPIVIFFIWIFAQIFSGVW